MRILIDECLDWRLCRALTEHHCVSVARMGWAGLTNGLLLERAEDEFDVFVTIDSNLTFQQNLTKFHIAVIVLEARSTRLADMISLNAAASRAFANHQTRRGGAYQFKLLISSYERFLRLRFLCLLCG